jgi:hypothetical protein
MKGSKIPVLDELKLNAMKDPEELLEVAISNKNPEVCKAAIDRLIKLDIIEERKAALVCSVVERTIHEPVARHALGYCSISTLPDNVKVRMIREAIGKIKFESVKKEMEEWLRKYSQ